MGWREGVCTDLRTELNSKGDRSIEIFRVLYDSGTPSHCVHGRQSDPARSMRLLSEEESTADVVGSDWTALRLRCEVSFSRLTDPAKGSACLHIAKCNLATLRQYAGQPCPCCSALIARSRDVRLDENLQQQLYGVPPSIETVWIRGDERHLVVIKMASPPAAVTLSAAAPASGNGKSVCRAARPRACAACSALSSATRATGAAFSMVCVAHVQSGFANYNAAA